MSFGLGLVIALMAIIAFALLAGRICHMGDLDRDPLDTPSTKLLSGVFLRIVGGPMGPPKS